MTGGDSTPLPAADAKRLRLIRQLQVKDPFVPLIHASTTTSSSASAGDEAGSRRAPGATRSRPVAKTVPFTPAAPTRAVIWTNGQRQVVGLHQVFNVGDAQFRLLAVTQKALRIEAVGGAFAGGKQAIRVRQGHPLKLANTATGVQYRFLFTRAASNLAVPDHPGRQLMNPIQRKANSVEMNNNDHRGVKGGLRRLRRPRLLITATALACVAAIPLAAGAAANRPSLAKPNALENFQLRLHDSGSRATAEVGATPTFSRTPSFAWAAGRLARRGTSSSSPPAGTSALTTAVIWSSRSLKTPAVAVPISLPWITGDHASLYWHVRAFGADGTFSQWSQPRGFNMRWADVNRKDHADDDIGVPQRLPSGPGYIRWTPVSGATGYDVWLGNLGGMGKVISTITTVADEREYYTLRTPPRDVVWRVRARRDVYGETANGLPRASYGPWSDVHGYQSPAGVQTPTTDVAKPLEDDLRPVRVRRRQRSGPCAYAGLRLRRMTASSLASRLHLRRTEDCVNVVYIGSIVGGTAYAPRITGPLALDPETSQELSKQRLFLLGGSEGEDSQVRRRVRHVERGASDRRLGQRGLSIRRQDRRAGARRPVGQQLAARPVLLDGRAGREAPVGDSSESSSTGSSDAKAEEESSFVYQDTVLPQDACQAGNVLMFEQAQHASPCSAQERHLTSPACRPPVGCCRQ